jgi:hypothetical protein
MQVRQLCSHGLREIKPTMSCKDVTRVRNKNPQNGGLFRKMGIEEVLSLF